MSEITTLEAIRQASEASKEYTDKQIDSVKSSGAQVGYVDLGTLFMNNVSEFVLDINHTPPTGHEICAFEVIDDCWLREGYENPGLTVDLIPKMAVYTVYCFADGTSEVHVTASNIRTLPWRVTYRDGHIIVVCYGGSREGYHYHHIRVRGLNFKIEEVRLAKLKDGYGGLMGERDTVRYWNLEKQAQQFDAQTYVQYASNDVRPEEVAQEARANSIVKRDADGDIMVNYAYPNMRDTEAANLVPNSKAVIAEIDNTVDPIKERVAVLEGAVLTYQEVESTGYTVTVPKNASEIAIVNSISGRPLDTVDLMSTIGTGDTYDYSPDQSAHASWSPMGQYGASYELYMTSYMSGMESGADTGILEPGTYTAIAIIRPNNGGDDDATQFQVFPFDTVYESDLSDEGLTMRTHTFTLTEPAPFYLRLQNNYSSSNDGYGGCYVHVYLRIYRSGPAAVSKVSSYDAAGVLVDSFEIPTAIRTLPAYGYADNKIDFDTKTYSQAYNTRSTDVYISEEFVRIGGEPSVPADVRVLDGFARVIIENYDGNTYLGAYTTEIENLGDYYNIDSYVYVPEISDNEIEEMLSNKVLVYRNYGESTVTTNISASLTAGPRKLKVFPGGTIVFENPNYNPCNSVITYLLAGGTEE